MAEVCRIRRLARYDHFFPRKGGSNNQAMQSSGNIQSSPKVVIVGGGFGGLSAAKELAGKPVSLNRFDTFSETLRISR
jgi:NADPH-dependent 2,4-dienoyl-CoA reductase/sulfur reductase-like enzyme